MSGSGNLRIYGLDFTSSPGRGKPLALASCALEVGVLRLEELLGWTSYLPLVKLLESPGPWALGADFPFSQSVRLLKETGGHVLGFGWPVSWEGYVRSVSGLGGGAFRELMKSCPRDDRGKRERRRVTDEVAGAVSPQHVDNPPVGMMFHQGSGLLLASPASIAPQRARGGDRLVFEAYPGAYARFFCGDKRYKGSAGKDAPVRAARRARMLELMRGERFRAVYGFTLELGQADGRRMTDDPKGDYLDALICAVQAAWAWTMRDENFGLPGLDLIDPEVLAFEGWIMDPHCRLP